MSQILRKPVLRHFQLLKRYLFVQITVNRNRIVGLASDVTNMSLFTFYFGHVPNKRYPITQTHIYIKSEYAEQQLFKQILRFLSLFTGLVINNHLWGVVEDMGSGNCASFGCPTSGKHKISLF